MKNVVVSWQFEVGTIYVLINSLQRWLRAYSDHFWKTSAYELRNTSEVVKEKRPADVIFIDSWENSVF